MSESRNWKKKLKGLQFVPDLRHHHLINPTENSRNFRRSSKRQKTSLTRLRKNTRSWKPDSRRVKKPYKICKNGSLRKKWKLSVYSDKSDRNLQNLRKRGVVHQALRKSRRRKRNETQALH